MSIPQARVIKHGPQLYTPPPPVRASEWRSQLRDAAALAIGMWPLIAVMLFMLAMFFVSAHWSAP